MYLYINNKRKNNITFKGKQRDDIKKARPLYPLPDVISSPRKPYRGVKSAGGGDCELHGAKVFKFCPNYSTIQEYPFCARYHI